VGRKITKKRKRSSELTMLQRAYLLTGHGYDFLQGEGEDWRRVFASDKAAKGAWKAHRAELEAECGDTCKPWAWFKYASRKKQAEALLQDADARRDRPVFPDAIQRGDWKLADDLRWSVHQHQWHSEYARRAEEHPDWAEVRAGIVKSGRFDPIWCRTWADVEAVKAGCWFDVSAGEKACAFFRLLRHTKAPYAGQPFILLPWQRFDVVMPLFGWKTPENLRRYRHAHVEIPKKNGKSTLCSGLSLLLLVADGEAGAEVYNVASDYKQANIVFREAMRMAKASPYLRDLLQFKPSVKHIGYEGANSEYEALSSDVGTKEGMNISGLIFDELHAQKNRDLFDALVYGGAARKQPLFLAITTAGVYDPLSIGWEQHEYARRVLEGGAGPGEDISFFGYIRNVSEDEADEWQDLYWWYRANPSLGVALDPATFAVEAKAAAEVPTKQNSFKRYRVNVWVQAAEAAFRIADWEACTEQDWPDLKGRICYGGLDLSATSDITAAVLWFPPDDEDGEHYLMTRFWLPKDNIVELARKAKAPYEAWCDAGHLELTPGNMVDLKKIRAELNAWHEEYDPVNWRYDKWHATGLVTDLTEEDGLPMVEFGQGFGWMNGPTREFERLMVTHQIRHNGNPVMSWMVGNCAFARDAEDRIKIMKTKKDQRFKVDGPVAAVMALDGAMRDSDGAMTLSADSLMVGG